LTLRRKLALGAAAAALGPVLAFALAGRAQGQLVQLASPCRAALAAGAGILAAVLGLALVAGRRTVAALERRNEALERAVEARTRDLEAAQARLVEAQKLAGLGQLGAGVAHEINNPLTGILGSAQLLLDARAGAPADRELLATIEALARRCRDVTQSLLRFSQQRADPDFREVELNKVVRDALTLVTVQLRDAAIALSLDLAEPSPRVKGDPGHLAQVVLHLLSNARTACLGRPRGAIRISTAVAGDETRLAVSDDGKGIAPEHLPRIFEPFFTTKDQWSNVGLGLSVSYRVVAEHGGRIAVETRQGQGSTFTVCLPSAPPAPRVT
jgi:signal transduction histidine kinase